MILEVPQGRGAPQAPTTIAVQAGRYIYPPEGLFDGQPGAKARFLKNADSADPSGLTFCENGDTVSFYSAGGGGYGDPLERDPAAVAQDVRLGYVSIERARRDYGVVIEPGSLNAEITATEELRAERKNKLDS